MTKSGHVLSGRCRRRIVRCCPKKWIVIIVICVLLLAVAGLTFYRGSKMDPELAAVGYTEEEPGPDEALPIEAKNEEAALE